MIMWPFQRVLSLFPFPEGPFIVGIKDVIFEYSKNGVLARFYYPTNLQNSITDYKSKWINWIPDDEYLKGLSAVIKIHWILIKCTLWLNALFFGDEKIPAVYGAKVRNGDKLKCIIFSHGLGAARFFSSTICCNLASYGFLVAAIEHRDHSACNTYYYESEGDVVKDVKTMIKYKNGLFDKSHLDTRYDQVLRRSNECLKLIDYLKEINDGHCPKNVLDFTQFDQFSLFDLIGRIDVDDLTISGHSFGAATSLMTLHQSDVRRAILLDAWMFPIKNVNDEICQKIEKPLIFINSETFHVISNVNAMEKYLNKSNVEMYTIMGTTHEFQTDSVHITGYLLNLTLKKLNAVTAVRLNDGLILTFLNKHVVNLNGRLQIEKYASLLGRYADYVKPNLTTPWQ